MRFVLGAGLRRAERPTRMKRAGGAPGGEERSLGLRRHRVGVAAASVGAVFLAGRHRSRPRRVSRAAARPAKIVGPRSSC
jgi:hypothetical protein